MKLLRYTLSILPVAILSISLQYCAVDPLDTPDGNDLSKTEGYNLCSDTTKSDTDSDGVNDECEIMLGTDPNSADSDSDGLGDKNDMPQNPPTPVCPPTTQDQTLINYCGGIQSLQNGLLNDTANSSLLTTAGLNGAAPAGTKVSVSSQNIRIVQEKKGLQDDPEDSYNFCKKKDKSQSEKYIYYKIVGDVVHCTSSDCQNKTATSKATMMLCAPFDGEEGAVSASLITTPISTIVVEKFNWTRGEAISFDALGKEVDVKFDPHLLQGNAPITETSLTIKPGTLEDLTYKTMTLTFKAAFKIYGTIEGTKTIIETNENIETTRNFGRVGVFSKDTTPGITGIWSAN